MVSSERVTVTLPADVVKDIDKLEKNRSKFVLEAVRHELERRRRQELHRSLSNPHPQTLELADEGFDEWASKLPDEDTEILIDSKGGRAVRWLEDKGWVTP